jgi:NTP pyrophosphatase (non-canonical NTP hydrolase)
MKELILKWADDRKLLHPQNCINQALKLFEETGELVSSILKGNRELEIDAFGDIQVVLIILTEQLRIDDIRIDLKKGYEKDQSLVLRLASDAGDICQFVQFYTFRELKPEIEWYYSTLHRLAKDRGVDLEQALELAWNEIKDRKGETINGTFIKNEKETTKYN